MTLRAEYQGRKYSGFHDYRVSRSLDELSGSFEMTFTSSDPNDPRFFPGDTVVIYVNSTPILTGNIDKRKQSYSNNEHIFTVSGRDKVADFVDSTVGANIELKAPITLDKILQILMKEIRMTGVPVHMQVHGLAPFAKGELISGQIDETIFSFLEKYTRKRQVLMTSDGKGGVVFARAGTARASTTLIHKIYDTSKNNIKEAEFDIDYSERYYEYRIWSQGNPSSAGTTVFVNSHQVANRVGTAFDKEIRKTRILDLTAECSSDLSILKKRAEWEANIRRARSQTYSCTVKGHDMVPGGKPWEPNMLVSIIDDFIPISDMMLIKSVEYSLNSQSGSETKLDLVSKDSYTPEPELSKPKKRHGKHGNRKPKKIYTQQDFEDYKKIVEKPKK